MPRRQGARNSSDDSGMVSGRDTKLLGYSVLITAGHNPPRSTLLKSKPNTTVKLANAAQVVAATSFFPSQDFHIKACFAYNPKQHRYGLIAGSGNFSRNGLVNSIEGGTLLTVKNEQEFRTTLRSAFLAAEGLWDSAEDLDAHIETYKERWVPQAVRPVRRAASPEGDGVSTPEDVDLGEFEFLWVDPGYVTKNRGPNLPGNQIDLPRGVHRFFELNAGEKPERNSEIGEITFVFPTEEVTRVLRFGNNMMEKITLPMPDRHGLGAYDGMVVEFRKSRPWICDQDF